MTTCCMNYRIKMTLSKLLGGFNFFEDIQVFYFMFLFSNVLVVSLFQWPISFDIMSTKSVFVNFNLGVGGCSPASPPPFGCAPQYNESDLCGTLHLEQLSHIIIRLQSFTIAECTEMFMACMFGGLNTYVLLTMYNWHSYLVVSMGSRV